MRWNHRYFHDFINAHFFFIFIARRKTKERQKEKQAKVIDCLFFGKLQIYKWFMIIIFTFLVRIFSAMDVADSSRSRSSIGAIDGPCSPRTLTKMKRTHRQRKRWKKFNATKKIDGFCTSVDSLALTVWPTPLRLLCCCCLLVILILRNNCTISRCNVVKFRLNKCCTEIIDLRKTFVNFSSAFFARGTDRRIRNGQTLNFCNGFVVFVWLLIDGNLLIVRCKIASVFFYFRE